MSSANMEPADQRPVTVELALVEIQQDPEIQPRARLNEATLSDYATLYDEAMSDDPEGAWEPLPPLDVFHIAGRNYVADGFHRLEAARRAMRTTLPCHVYQGTPREAMLHAARANLRRGLPYTPQDRERILTRFLHDPEMQQVSARDLAAELGMSHMTVNRARHRQAALTTLQAEWETLGAPATTPMAQAAAFLDVDPTTLRASKLAPEEVVPRLARLMSDQGLAEHDAKAQVREWVERQAALTIHSRKHRQQEHQRQAAQQAAQQAARNEQQQRQAAARNEQREAEQRTAPARELLERLTQVIEVCREEPYPVAARIAGLTAAQRRTVATLLQEAATGLQRVGQALGAPRPKAPRTQGGAR